MRQQSQQNPSQVTRTGFSLLTRMVLPERVSPEFAHLHTGCLVLHFEVCATCMDLRIVDTRSVSGGNLNVDEIQADTQPLKFFTKA